MRPTILSCKKVALLLLCLSSILYAKNRFDSSVTWCAFSGGWKVQEENSRFLLAYDDLRREHEVPVNLFCRTKLKEGCAVAGKIRISGILDSVYFGIFCRNADLHYDFMLTGNRTLTTVATFYRTFTVDEVFKRELQPMAKNIRTDTLWHDIRFTVRDGSLDIRYDTSLAGRVDLPFTPAESLSWGLSALYCGVALKDLVMIDKTADTLPLPVDTAGVLIAPVFKKRSGSSDRILGY